MIAVESLQRGHTPESRTALRAVFLHTGWRSGGTWLWSQCRDRPGVRGLYEPLHEGIADLRAADIDRLRPGSWRSSHGDTAPYFEEYHPLLRPGRRGVAGYERRFAFDGFFLDAAADDPALEAYLHGLIASQAGLGRAVVLKFCRSLGRVGWLEQRFPHALHAVVLRRPLAQWRSCQRLLVEQRNRYFTIAPVLVLARNATHPLVRDVCTALDVRLPDLHSRDLAYGMETVWRHGRRQTTADRYRAFLAYWTATALSALQSRALVIDTARLAGCAETCAALEAALEPVVGARLKLAPKPESAPAIEGEIADDMAAAHHEARACAAALGRDLDPARLDDLVQHLREPGLPPPAPRTRKSRAPPRSGVLMRARTVAMVGFARALQPMRRLHGDFVNRD